MMPLEIHPARQSRLAAFPVKIVLVDFRQLGTHEVTRDPSKAERLAESIQHHGYEGPLPAVMQANSDFWYDTIKSDQTLPVLSYGELGIADGHHRLSALANLFQQGHLAQPLIPVQLIPAHDSSLIRLATLHPKEVTLSLSDIEACFTNPDLTIPASSTTHFQARLKDNSWVRLAQAQPDIQVSELTAKPIR